MKLTLLCVLASLFAHVNIATKALHDRLQRVRESRGAGLSWLDAWRVSGMHPIAGGASLAEIQHAAAFVLTEVDNQGNYCRDTVTVLSGQNLKAGAVVGAVMLAVGKADIPAVVGTGNGTMTKLFAGPDVQKGNYVVTCITAVTNGGVFTVTNPSGKKLPNLTLTVGAGATTAYTSREINFSITDGSTDFAATDAFTVAVVASTSATVVGTGNGTLTGLSLGPDARTGQYRVENIEAITNGGRFKVVSPDGDVIAVGSIVAGAGGTLVLANQRQLNLTLTDSTTDFAVGDFFEVFAYNELVGKMAAWDPVTFDGRHRAVGLLYADVDATAADTPGVILARAAEVIDAMLVWATAVSAAQQAQGKKQLTALGIVPR